MMTVSVAVCKANCICFEMIFEWIIRKCAIIIMAEIPHLLVDPQNHCNTEVLNLRRNLIRPPHKRIVKIDKNLHLCTVAWYDSLSIGTHTLVSLTPLDLHWHILLGSCASEYVCAIHYFYMLSSFLSHIIKINTLEVVNCTIYVE